MAYQFVSRGCAPGGSTRCCTRAIPFCFPSDKRDRRGDRYLEATTVSSWFHDGDFIVSPRRYYLHRPVDDHSEKSLSPRRWLVIVVVVVTPSTTPSRSIRWLSLAFGERFLSNVVASCIGCNPSRLPDFARVTIGCRSINRSIDRLVTTSSRNYLLPSFPPSTLPYARVFKAKSWKKYSFFYLV